MARGEGVKKVGDLFEKYARTLRAPQGSVVKVFCEVVEDVLGLSLVSDQVKYSPHDRVLHLKTHGSLKSELLIHKTELLAHTKGRLGEQSAPVDMV